MLWNKTCMWKCSRGRLMVPMYVLTLLSLSKCKYVYAAVPWHPREGSIANQWQHTYYSRWVGGGVEKKRLVDWATPLLFTTCCTSHLWNSSIKKRTLPVIMFLLTFNTKYYAQLCATEIERFLDKHYKSTKWNRDVQNLQITVIARVATITLTNARMLVHPLPLPHLCRWEVFPS